MPKVIKIIVSDKFFEEHIAGDIEALTTQNVGIAEGMVRMLIGEHFKDAEEIELNTDDVTDRTNDQGYHSFYPRLFNR